jgi:hypothetical protein
LARKELIELLSRKKLAVLFLMSLPSVASAATWYVNPAGGSAGDGSFNSPFELIAEAMSAAAVGDSVSLAAGIYSDTVPTTAYGNPRLALMILKEGVSVVGAGRGVTILEALPADTLTFGVTAENVGGSASVSDLTIRGACFHGLNLRSSSPQVKRVDIVNEVTGSSSVSCDVRDLSFPEFEEVLFDGGHTAFVVEFGAGGVYRNCTVGVRPNEGLICNNATPEILDTVFLGAGRDVLVFAQGSQPIMNRCTIADGVRNAVRVAVYLPDSQIDLSGNTWFSAVPAEVQARILDASVNPLLGATVVFEPFDEGNVSAIPVSFGDVKSRYR